MSPNNQSVLCFEKHGGRCRQPVAAPSYLCRYPGHNNGHAHVYGRAGEGLRTNAGNYSAQNVAAGLRGEVAASRVLWEAFRDDPAVHIFQDVKLPTDHANANADFVIVRGNQVAVVDAKQWPKGFYWSLGGLPRGGPKLFAPFAPAITTNVHGQSYANKTVSWACDLFTEALRDRPGWHVSSAYLIIPPYKDPQAWRRYHTWAMRLYGSMKMVAGNPATIPRLRAMVRSNKPPAPDDQGVLDWFATLVVAQPNKPGAK